MRNIKVSYQSCGIDVTLSIEEDWHNSARLDGDFALIVEKVISDLGIDPVEVIEMLIHRFEYNLPQNEKE